MSLGHRRFEKLQVSDAKGTLRERILAKVCTPDSVVGNFTNSDQNGRTVRELVAVPAY